MGMRFRDYLLEQKESFFEDNYPFKEDGKSDDTLTDEQDTAPKTDSAE